MPYYGCKDGILIVNGKGLIDIRYCNSWVAILRLDTQRSTLLSTLLSVGVHYGSSDRAEIILGIHS